MAINGLHPQLRETLVTHVCHNLNKLASRAVGIKHIIQEKEKKCDVQGRGPHVVSITGKDEFNNDISTDSTIDILTIES